MSPISTRWKRQESGKARQVSGKLYQHSHYPQQAHQKVRQRSGTENDIATSSYHAKRNLRRKEVHMNTLEVLTLLLVIFAALTYLDN